MQAVVLEAARALLVKDVAPPVPGPGEVLLDVTLCGICGSDLHGYAGESARRTRNTPLIMGHEISGRVADASCAPDSPWRKGDRVVVQPLIACGRCPTCRAGRENVCPNMQIIGIERPGGFAPFVAVPASALFVLPDTISDLDAVFIEPLAIQVRAMRLGASPLPRSILILGAGSQGLLAVQLAHIMGIPCIVVSDPVPERRILAKSLGATFTVDPGTHDAEASARTIVGGDGVELAIEASGADAARALGLRMLQPGGTMAIVGLGPSHQPIDLASLVAQEKRIQGVYCYSTDDFTRSLEIIERGQIVTDSMTAIRPLHEGPAIFAAFGNGTAPAIKVVLDPRRSAEEETR